MMLRDVRNRKSELRRMLRERDRRVGSEERAVAGELICRLFATVSGWESRRTILFFAPLSTEPDIRPLIIRALAEGKTVLLPRFDPEAETYRPARIGAWPDDLVKGRFGVMEPGEDCGFVGFDTIELTLVPGVAFDGRGRRLGHGAGYYDRILAEASGERAGIAFDWQMVEEAPSEAHDAAMDWIVTQSGYVVCGGAGDKKRRPEAAF